MLELLIVVCTVVVIVVRRVTQGDCLSRLLSVRLQLCIGFVVGLTAAVVVLMRRIDLVPDTLERPIAITSVGVAGVIWAVMSGLRRWAAFSRPQGRRSAAESRSSASSSESLTGPGC